MLNFGALPSAANANDFFMATSESMTTTPTNINKKGSNEDRLHTIQQNIRFINLSLQKMNMESPFPFRSFTTNPPPSGVELEELELSTTILIDLVNSKKREESFRKEFSERYSNIEKDLNSRDDVIKRFYQQLEASERDLKTSEKRIIILEEKLSATEKKSTTSADEVSKLKSIIAKKDKNFNHELKRKEMEFDRLKLQLQRLVHEPPVHTAANDAIGMSIKKSKSSMQMGELHSSLFMDDDSPPAGHNNDPIDRLETLENENANLRQLLSSLNTVLGQMKLQNPAIKEAPQDHSEQLSILPISWVYDLVREEIEGSLEAISEMIHSHN